MKTRLAAGVGQTAAADVARLFIQALLQRLKITGDQHVVGFAPTEQRTAFEELAGAAWQLRPQCDGDLGQRMQHYFQQAFDAGADRVLLLGADSPNLPLATIEEALVALETVRLVLAPTDDGGYCLIGASRQPPPVLDDMPWSQTELWQATRNRLDHLNWQEGTDWSCLRAWYDVDTADDLTRLRQDLAASNEPALITLRDELHRILPND